MFSKFKNIFYLAKSKFFHGCCAILRVGFGGILFKVKCFLVVGVVAILLPCFIYAMPLFWGEIIPESFEGFQVAVDVTMEKEFTEVTGTTSPHYFGVASQIDEFGIKGISERAGGLVELADFVNVKSIPISNPTADECTNNGKATSNEYQFVGTKVQFWFSLFLGGLIGAIISYVLLKLIFRFVTQRRVQRQAGYETLYKS